jgi:hypothetical protein
LIAFAGWCLNIYSFLRYGRDVRREPLEFSNIRIAPFRDAAEFAYGGTPVILVECVAKIADLGSLRHV